MNIADYYIKGLPAIGEWRDMHMRIEGDVVNTLQEIFLTMWNKETKQHIGGEAYFPLQQSKSDERNMLVAIVDRTPRKTPWTLGRAYAKSIEEAQDNINIITPYYSADQNHHQGAETHVEKKVSRSPSWCFRPLIFRLLRSCTLQTTQTDEKGSPCVSLQRRIPSL